MLVHELNQVTLSEVEHENILVQKMSQNRYTGSFNAQVKPNAYTGSLLFHVFKDTVLYSSY